MTNQDLREQLFNERKTGTLVEVALPLERITSLAGILLDLDPGLYRPGNVIFPPADDPKAFYERIKPALDRHPLAGSAEVRQSGTGLHLIVRIDPAVELSSAAAQKRWDAIIRLLQCSLPADGNAPGITALTRPIGSTNSKNGRMVELLRPGKGITAENVEQFATQFSKAPFREIAVILFGQRRVSPCPVCQAEGSCLDALDHVGMCYRTCGKVRLSQLLDVIYQPAPGPQATIAQGEEREQATVTPPVREPLGKEVNLRKSRGRKSRMSVLGSMKAD